jgi:TolB protein
MKSKIRLMRYICGLLLSMLALSSCGKQASMTATAVFTHTAIPSATFTDVPNTSTPVPTDTATPSPVPQPHLQLTYVSWQDDISSVYALPIECPNENPPCIGEPTLLFEFNSRIFHLSWSPDGRCVIFDAVGTEGRSDIFIADWNGDHLVNLTNSPEHEDSPVWSPDGSRIGYDGCFNGRCGFFSTNLDGSETLPLLDQLEGSSITALWSPDGEQFLLSGSILESFMQIYLANPDGSNLTRLTQDETDHFSPVFSPDGEWIAFIRIYDPIQWDSSDIFIIRPDGSDERNLTGGATALQGSLAWSPLGDWLAFSGENEIGGNQGIYLIHPDGTGFIDVTQNGGEYWAPAWRSFYAP